MAINNPIVNSAAEGILRYAGISDSGYPGYLEFHDGKWVIVSSDTFRSIGNAQSGASIAEDWLLKLFAFVYTNYATAISTATGQLSTKDTIEEDWNAAKRLQLPDFRGRVLMAAGTGQGLSQRIRGAAIGAERHVLTIAEMPAHSHQAIFAAGSDISGTVTLTPASSRSNTQPGPSTTSVGGNSPHNNVQPSLVEMLWMSAGVF